MKTKLFTSTLAAGVLAATLGSAATIDLTDESFSSVSYVTFPASPPSTGPINAFSETASGVTFSFATSGQFRNMGAWGNGSLGPSNPMLQFGGGGGNPASFTMSVDQDVTLNSFLGFAQQFNTNPIFDVNGTGVASMGNTFSTSAFPSTGVPVVESFAGGPLSLAAGELYTFNVTNGGSATNGYITSFDFSAVSADIPLPAGMPLLLAGLGAFGVMRRRQKA